MTARGAFQLVSAVVLGLILYLAVLRPAVERGGFLELLGVAIAVSIVILGERWLRTR